MNAAGGKREVPAILTAMGIMPAVGGALFAGRIVYEFDRPDMAAWSADDRFRHNARRLWHSRAVGTLSRVALGACRRSRGGLPPHLDVSVADATDCRRGAQLWIALRSLWVLETPHRKSLRHRAGNALLADERRRHGGKSTSAAPRCKGLRHQYAQSRRRESPGHRRTQGTHRPQRMARCPRRPKVACGRKVGGERRGLLTDRQVWRRWGQPSRAAARGLCRTPISDAVGGMDGPRVHSRQHQAASRAASAGDLPPSWPRNRCRSGARPRRSWGK